MSESENEENWDKPGDGMVRKTRRVRKKRRVKRSPEKAKEDANSLFAKAKELLIGMHDEDEDFAHIDVAEQVRRLKNKKEDDRPLDEVWGTKQRSTSWLWIVLTAAIVSVVAIVVGLSMWAREDPSGAGDAMVLDDDRFKLKDVDFSDGPLGWYHENSVEVVNEIESIIGKLNEAEEAEEISKLVRDSPFRAVNPIDPDLLGDDMLTNAAGDFRWIPEVVYSSEQSGAKERGYLKVVGKREDRSPYEAYFVLEDGQVVMDWDATHGWSEMPLPQLIEEKPRKAMLLRCRLTKRVSFDQNFGDIPYSGYILSGESEENFLFAYVNLDTPRGQAIDRDLRLLLNFGSFTSSRPPNENEKGTVTVRFNKEIGEEGQFEIVDFLHDGWVTP